ncbi:MAG: hypothetical protein IT384_34780 [Deltaproteobacteria bacterium]|nr:hypothetical protein [Deltaproteobacteria bacterium]
MKPQLNIGQQGYLAKANLIEPTPEELKKFCEPIARTALDKYFKDPQQAGAAKPSRGDPKIFGADPDTAAGSVTFKKRLSTGQPARTFDLVVRNNELIAIQRGLVPDSKGQVQVFLLGQLPQF